jgi:hypothetical protein
MPFVDFVMASEIFWTISTPRLTAADAIDDTDK